MAFYAKEWCNNHLGKLGRIFYICGAIFELEG